MKHRAMAAEVCGWGSILVGLVAAGFWVWSALVDISVPIDAVLLDQTNPFIVALHRAARLNAWAAGWTAASVALAAIERAIRIT
jgi:hypothetical protein